MNYLTLDEIKGWGALPPAEMQERVQRRFVEEFRHRRESLPSIARNHAIILCMLESPIWGKWGQIGSYTAARKVLDKYWPEWTSASDADTDKQSDTLNTTEP